MESSGVHPRGGNAARPQPRNFHKVCFAAGAILVAGPRLINYMERKALWADFQKQLDAHDAEMEAARNHAQQRIDAMMKEVKEGREETARLHAQLLARKRASRSRKNGGADS